MVQFCMELDPAGLKPAGEIVGSNELCEVLVQLVMRFVVEGLDGGVLYRAVHPFDLDRWSTGVLPASNGAQYRSRSVLYGFYRERFRSGVEGTSLRLFCPIADEARYRRTFWSDRCR